MVGIAEIRDAASGRWPEIMQRLGGLSVDQLDGRHQPCPRCGGTDRYRVFGDFAETGGMICNQCYRGGDGLDALTWLTSQPLPVVIRDLADHLGMRRRQPPTDEPEQSQPAAESTDESEKTGPVDFLSLREGELDRGPETIKGLLRNGEVCFVGSSSKASKSWLVAGLAWSVISGTPWLGFGVQPGKVLLFDNELKPREIDFRYTAVAREMQYEPAKGDLAVESLRGQDADVYQIESICSSMDLSGYSLIIIDAIYKTIPEGKSENDNEAMGRLMNALQRIADSTGVAVVCVHHATKGDQSSKAALDVFAGAGAFGRALDSAVIVRPHEDEGCSVIEFQRRSGPPPKAISAKFEFPIWVPTNAAPKLSNSKATQKKREDQSEWPKILAAIAEHGEASPSLIKKHTGMNAEKASRVMAGMHAAGQLDREFRLSRKVETPYYSLPKKEQK